MKNKILSFLLNQANRETKSREYYAVKDIILKKYGTLIGYDVQHIPGKECFSCNGTGRHYNAYEQCYDDCWNCSNGWYKRPVWNILEKIQFGRYVFHRPYKRCYIKPDEYHPTIQGYIEHNAGKYGKISLFILLLIYEKGYLKRWWTTPRIGYYSYWWRWNNFINNLFYIWQHRKIKFKKINPEAYDNENLPF